MNPIFLELKRKGNLIFSVISVLLLAVFATVIINFSDIQEKSKFKYVLLYQTKELQDVALEYKELQILVRSYFDKNDPSSYDKVLETKKNLYKELEDVSYIYPYWGPELQTHYRHLTSLVYEELDYLDYLISLNKKDKNYYNLDMFGVSLLTQHNKIAKILDDMLLFEQAELEKSIQQSEFKQTRLNYFYLLTGIPISILIGILLILYYRAVNLKSETFIREKIELTKELVNCKEQTAKVVKDYKSFCYSVSHDLRAPIRAIQGFCNLINEFHKKKDYGDSFERYIVLILEQSERAAGLIDGLLNLTRLGRKTMQLTEVNFNDLVSTIVKEETKNNTKVNIIVDNLPNANADLTLLVQVWKNLISNAVKFSSKKENPQIRIGYLKEKDAYFVKDNGVGFDNKYSEKLFQLFQRLCSDSEFEGYGVGLSIANQIISNHKGRIWAEGVPNEGATFYFTLSHG